MLGANSVVSRAAVRALQLVADLSPLQAVLIADLEGNGPASRLDPISRALLDVVYNGLPAQGFSGFNLTVAKFKVGDEPVGAGIEARPSLHAVRFEGSHLLDSVDACRLIVSERRPLVELVMHTSKSFLSSEATGRYSLRLGVENDHWAVTTGFGTQLPEGSLAAHRSAVAVVQQELSSGLLNEPRLHALVTRIAERAAAKLPPDKADLFVGDVPSP